jgi:hypothetical protein
MNGDTGGNGGSRRARHQGSPHAGYLAVTAAVAVLATACGGGAPSSAGSVSGGSGRYQQALAYSECMRSHGVPNFPDPDAAGNIIQHVAAGQPGGNTPQEQKADNTCHHLLPGGGAGNTGTQRRTVTRLLKLATCIRAHGVPNFPDPTVSNAPAGGDTVSLPGNVTLGLGSAGVDLHSRQFQVAERACRSLTPAGLFPTAR